MWREFLSKLMLMVVSLFITTVILEIGLRFFVTLPSPYELDDARLVQDKREFWLNKPNAKQYFTNNVDFQNALVRNDQNGLRFIPCRKNTKGERRRRIYIVGDSQTYGWGLTDEQSWPNQIQCLLNQTSSAFAVYNLGVPGTNLDQYYYRTRLIYDHLKPDDILVYVITWNDWHTDHSQMVFPPSLSGKCTGVEQVDRDISICTEKPFKFQARKSTWRRSFYKKTGIFVPVLTDLHLAIHTLRLGTAIGFLAIPPLKALYLRFRPGNSLQKIGPEVFEFNRTLVGKMASETKNIKDVHFVFLPSRISYADMVYKIYSKNGTVFKHQDFLFDLAKGACQEYKLRCHSLFGALHTANIGDFDFKYDGHLNADGAKAVARYMVQNIIR